MDVVKEDRKLVGVKEGDAEDKVDEIRWLSVATLRQQPEVAGEDAHGLAKGE